jgi:hypothetical protein
MTVINQHAALRRFHQGLYYLLGTTNQGREKAASKSFLAAGVIMAYLGACGRQASICLLGTPARETTLGISMAVLLSLVPLLIPPARAQHP